jgi:hypothetical protein
MLDPFCCSCPFLFRFFSCSRFFINDLFIFIVAISHTVFLDMSARRLRALRNGHEAIKNSILSAFGATVKFCPAKVMSREVVLVENITDKVPILI